MELDDRKGIVVLTGNSHPELAKLVVQCVLGALFLSNDCIFADVSVCVLVSARCW